MAAEIKEALLYDFNFNFFVANTSLPNVKNVEDRQNAVKWLRLLKTSGQTMQEMKLRNDFIYHLVKSVQAGAMSAPFDKPPPNLPLLSMVSLLPAVDFDDDTPDPVSCPGARKTPAIMQRSPDAGAFLAAQPIPDVGAFCYVAVLTKNNQA